MKPGAAFFLVTVCFPVLLQAQPHSDSLEAQLSALTGAARVAVLADLVEAHYRNDPDRAIAYGHEALALLTRHPNDDLLRRVLFRKGQAHDYVGGVDSVSAQAERLAATRTGGGEADAAQLESLVQQNQGDYDAAIASLEDALAGYEAAGEQAGTALALLTLGFTHRQRSDYDAALFLNRAQAFYEVLADRQGLADALHQIGVVHRRQGDYDTALSLCMRALALREELGDTWGLAASFNSIGILHRRRSDYDQALSATDRALTLADSIGALPLVRDVQLQRTGLLESQGRYAEALAAHRAYKAAYDSLFNSESQGVIAELQQQYRAKEQQQRIDLLESRRRQQRLWVAALLAGLGLLVAVIALLTGRMRLRRRALAAIEQARRETEEKAEELARANALKSRFLANISHEFRTPLTLTFGPLDDALSGCFASFNEARPHFERARRNGGRLLRLINQLLDLSKLDAGARGAGHRAGAGERVGGVARGNDCGREHGRFRHTLYGAPAGGGADEAREAGSSAGGRTGVNAPG